MEKVQTLKRLTMRDILGMGGKKEAELKKAMIEFAESGDGEECVDVGGDIRAYGTKMTNLGESVFLIGTFVARNRITGKHYKSGKAYLPKSLTEDLCAVFDKMRDQGAPVNFACTISVVPHDKSGFTYVSEDLKTPEVAAREVELLSVFPEIKALPKPKK